MFGMLPKMDTYPLRLTKMIIPESWCLRGNSFTYIIVHPYIFLLFTTTRASFKEESSGKQVPFIYLSYQQPDWTKKHVLFSCSIHATFAPIEWEGPNLHTLLCF